VLRHLPDVNVSSNPTMTYHGKTDKHKSMLCLIISAMFFNF
jgi:hypothetical protein